MQSGRAMVQVQCATIWYKGQQLRKVVQKSDLIFQNTLHLAFTMCKQWVPILDIWEKIDRVRQGRAVHDTVF